MCTIYIFNLTPILVPMLNCVRNSLEGTRSSYTEVNRYVIFGKITKLYLQSRKRIKFYNI
jgi:hypothetical protein